MTEITKRLAELSPLKRAQLLAQLKARAPAGGTATATAAPDQEAPPLLLNLDLPTEPVSVKADYKRFYDSVSSQLNASVFGQFSYFLNYGYVADGSPQFASVDLPDQFINKNSVKLVLELVGDCRVDGMRVLDVGCGRGGTLYTLKTFFKPRTLTGLDLSSEAIAFDRHAHGDSRTFFHEGDAEHLPFPDGSFDIVTNVESSHSYPNITRFYTEVGRVLGPGGHFLYTDALAISQITSGLAYLDHLGFELLRNRNITANVLRSCDEVSRSRVQAFDTRNDQNLMHNFLATPGSQVYEEMRTGRWEYRIFKLRRRAGSA